MIDHVTIRTPDLEAARRFYGRTFRLLAFPGEPFESDGLVEWDDFSVAAEADGTPATRRLHIGFRAESPGMVDAWWHAMTAAGCADAGPPGPRPAYGSDYYGGFVLDPAGNSVEAVNNGPRRQAGVIDHLWLRVHDLEASTRFYEAVCPSVDHTVERYAGRTQIRGGGGYSGSTTNSITCGRSAANASSHAEAIMSGAEHRIARSPSVLAYSAIAMAGTV